MVTLSRTNQLQELIRQFGMLQKAATKQYGQPSDGLTPILRKVIMVVGMATNANIKYIAATLQVTSGAATQHVAALEELGYAERQASSQDRREVLVRLTVAGHDRCKHIKRRTLQILESMFAELDDHELQQLTQLIYKVSNKHQIKGEL